jgi:hypothetical protein
MYSSWAAPRADKQLIGVTIGLTVSVVHVEIINTEGFIESGRDVGREGREGYYQGPSMRPSNDTCIRRSMVVRSPYRLRTLPRYRTRAPHNTEEDTGSGKE